MTCKNCGAANDKNSKYCSACGSLVDESLYTRKKKELAKTIVFLLSSLIILFAVIYRIQSDFDNFISYDLPLNLSVEATKDKLVGAWISDDGSSMFKYAKFKDDSFKLLYNQADKSLEGTYFIADSNTMILYVDLINGESTGEPLDMQYKFHFQGDDTLVVVFNGISNIFERKE